MDNNPWFIGHIGRKPLFQDGWSKGGDFTSQSQFHFLQFIIYPCLFRDHPRDRLDPSIWGRHGHQLHWWLGLIGWQLRHRPYGKFLWWSVIGSELCRLPTCIFFISLNVVHNYSALVCWILGGPEILSYAHPLVELFEWTMGSKYIN